MNDTPMTTTQAAQALGITVQGVIAAINRGTLEATKLGEGRRGTWSITRAEVERYKVERRRPGRPAAE